LSSAARWSHPQLNGSILPGITRKSVIELGTQLGACPYRKREISIDEIIEAHQSAQATECYCQRYRRRGFPIGEVVLQRPSHLHIKQWRGGELALKFYQTLTVSILYGRAADTWGDTKSSDTNASKGKRGA
jgi:branched-chain amino acid aminotransferase